MVCGQTVLDCVCTGGRALALKLVYPTRLSYMENNPGHSLMNSSSQCADFPMKLWNCVCVCECEDAKKIEPASSQIAANKQAQAISSQCLFYWLNNSLRICPIVCHRLYKVSVELKCISFKPRLGPTLGKGRDTREHASQPSIESASQSVSQCSPLAILLSRFNSFCVRVCWIGRLGFDSTLTVSLRFP